MTAETKIWDKTAVQALIETNDRALARALWLIFKRQTVAEQAALQTTEHNGRGFTSHDAEFLSDIAKRLPTYDFRMTPRQIAKVRPKMRKYWRQLLEEIVSAGGQTCQKVAKSPKHDIAKEREPEKENSLFGAYAM